MASINTPLQERPVLTHEGGPAVRTSALLELRRSVLVALLWENTYYEKGSQVAARIEALVAKCAPEDVAALAVEARDKMYLRHVPLYLVRLLAKLGHGKLVAETLPKIVQRPDELGEYLAIYWAGKASGTAKRPAPLSAGSKRGLAAAFRKFRREETLAKYDRDAAVRLRDVLRLVHPKPQDAEQAAIWKRAISRELATPDTWEVALSKGADKKATFERLLAEQKLGGLAFLRNLRNMIDAGVDGALIRARFEGEFRKVLPFRFVSAARYAPSLVAELDAAMLRAVQELPRLKGKTGVLVDVSGSMDYPLSAKSEMKRMDAAAGLAVLIREQAENCRVFSFSENAVEVAAYRGLALAKAIVDSQPHGGTMLGAALKAMTKKAQFDRIIVVTDEQSGDEVSAPAAKGYIINVAPYQNGVGYGKWAHIDGWSERIFDFIYALETEGQAVG